MSTHADAEFSVKSWDEATYDEGEGGRKLTRAHVVYTFHGDLEGVGTVEYLMIYRPDGTATYVGLERVIGRLGDRTGSFVLQHTGGFEGGWARATLAVVPGSGTGDLEDLQGEGRLAAPHEGTATYTLDYDFA